MFKVVTKTGIVFLEGNEFGFESTLVFFFREHE